MYMRLNTFWGRLQQLQSDLGEAQSPSAVGLPFGCTEEAAALFKTTPLPADHPLGGSESICVRSVVGIC